MARGRAAAGGCARCMGGAARRGPSPPGPPLCGGSGRRRTAHGRPRRLGSARLPCPARRAQRSGTKGRGRGGSGAARVGGERAGRGRAERRGGAAGRGRGCGVVGAESWRPHTDPPAPPAQAGARGLRPGLSGAGGQARPCPPPPPPPARSHPPFRAASAAAPPRTLSPRPCRRGRVRPPAPRPGAGSPTPTGVTQRGDVRRRAPPGRERGRWLSINLTLHDSDRGETGRAGASFTGSPRGLNISLFFLPQKKTRGVIVCLITQLPIPETKWPYRLNRILLRILKTGYRTGAGTCAETLPRPRSPRALTCEDRQRGTKLTEALARHLKSVGAGRV